VRLSGRRPEDLRAPAMEKVVALRASGGFSGRLAKAVVATPRRPR
jgi:hypothetical protein